MHLTVVSGCNFSGRTAHLREWVGLPTDRTREAAVTDCAFVGPDPSTALSGLTHSVEAEIDMMAEDPTAGRKARDALEEFGMHSLLYRNPFTLSGGEQVIVALVAAAASRPRRIAVDCSLEQLSPDMRTRLLGWLDQQEGELMIADNRLQEWHDGEVVGLPAPTATANIDVAFWSAYAAPATELQLVDLSFGYERAKLVFEGLNLTFQAGRGYRLKGANGAGKSTLSKILCGLLKPTGGEILVDGRKAEPWRRPGLGVSYHFQSPSLQLFAPSLRRQMRGATDPRSALAAMGINSPLDSHPLDLPFVLQKRLALSNALVRGFSFVIADEPTLGQDDDSSSSVARLLDGFGGLRISHSRKFDHLETVTL